MEAVSVLALDLSTDTGWALGPVGGTPRCHSLPLGDRSATAEEKGAKLVRFLVDLFKVERPKLVVIEKPLNTAVLNKIGAHFNTTYMLYGLAHTAAVVAQMSGVQMIRFADVQDVTAHFCGQRTFKAGYDPVRRKQLTSRQARKAAVIAACERQGWHVEDDNAADAAATWSYGCAMLNPRLAAAVTPLFAPAGNQNPQSPSNRDVSAGGKASSTAAPQGKAVHAGIGSETPADREGQPHSGDDDLEIPTFLRRGHPDCTAGKRAGGAA
jgi:hypothetical protein